MSHTHRKPLFLISSSDLKSLVIVLIFLMLSMASSSSLSRSWLYHVFLSFRGVDVRKGFLSHVRKGLESKGIIAFVDDEMERGESVGPLLVGAIRQSRVAIVLLSSNYTSSSWCLDELVEIMKCRDEYKQPVLPIFYKVDPSDVRKQKGDFGKVFDETCLGKTEEVKETWRKALKDVAGIAGYDNCDSEADLINKVASDVTAVLGFTPSKDFDNFVGIERRIIDIKSKFILQSEQVKMIVLVGPAGIGKTTTARVLYNQLSPGFPFSTFLENIRGNYEKPCGNDYSLKLRFHQNLLSQLLNQKDIVVGHLGVAQNMLSDKKVLAVLDEVDNLWQLEEIAKQREWVGPGSIVIITTEDVKLLKQLRLGIDHIYKMKFPTKDESLEIFCQYAFDQNSPYDGFEDLAREVTWLAGNLPLGLRVMGSYLRGMSMDYWIKALPRLRSSLNTEIESTLRFSYDALSDDKDKALFLHIACFFSRIDCKVDSLKRCLEKSGLDVDHGLDVLAHKSLISIDYSGYVKMHSLLQQLGREIVKKQSLKERQFLMDAKDISDLLEENTVNGEVLGIMLDASNQSEEVHISKSAFEGMNSLQFLTVDYDKLCIPEGLNCLPNKLRLIHWNYCPLRFWPSKFSFKFLVELIMPNSKFEKLWEGIQPLQCLKLMDLKESCYLKEIPDLSNATSLEELVLCGCTSLLEITSSIGNATKLKKCNLFGCWLLKELPSSISRLINLKELDLCGCQTLKAVSVFSSLEKLSGCSSLKELRLTGTEIEEVPLSMSTWSCLYKLDVSDCRNLKEFPNVPDSIVELVLCKTRIEEVPSWIGNLFRLRKLIMYGCKKLKTISPNISKLDNLEFLGLRKDGEYEYDDEFVGESGLKLFEAVIKWGPDLNHSWKLRSDFRVHHILPICLPKKAFTSPVSLCLRCVGLKTIPDCIGFLSGLSELDITMCRNLRALPQLPASLISLDAVDCVFLKRIDSSFQNPNICLNFYGCYKLNQKARKIIQTSHCKYALLPGEEVPAHFTHRATSDSLTINLSPKSLPSPCRFRGCILVPRDSRYYSVPESSLSCSVSGKQNDLTVEYGSNQLHHMPPDLFGYPKHLYIFEDYFCLNQDCPETEETTSSELSFVFRLHDEDVKIKGCGVQLLEVPNCVTDENADNYNDDNNDDDGDGDGDDGEEEEYESDDDNDGDCDEDETDDDGEEQEYESDSYGRGFDYSHPNQKWKNLIRTSDCESALVEGVEVPADFTHQATSGSLTINITPGSLPSSLRFKACILLSRHYDNREEDENLLMRVSCSRMASLSHMDQTSTICLIYMDMKKTICIHSKILSV
ncbi:PREDICTED: disease resistance protein TAO1-like [Brassica oleracea var. oleracea]|uniref:ADP-ribosyl cyclase/cyclic ADP-ribose hydrolase n=1 Tax=Brassica oleracea var. oleracea TaxID=109376 RepID=A0A0D3AJQ2_BRAOL|nr:PREDICTED: disease resistance protein TAO1-like [Brassica oleracea var. oleracea]